MSGKLKGFTPLEIARPKSPSGAQARARFLTGFTLIEMIISFGILSILAGLGLAISMDYFRTYSFNYEENLLVQILQKARSESLANINQRNHGFYATGGQYVIFQGDSYSARDVSLDQTFPASKTVNISGVPSAGVIFNQLSATSSPTDIIIKQDAKIKIISINEEGRINY
jgi:Tfp pilus assembly protein FimT